MADQSDVEQALAAVVAAVLYPGGTTAASLVGVACRVHRGWPDAASLDADLKREELTLQASLKQYEIDNQPNPAQTNIKEAEPVS